MLWKLYFICSFLLTVLCIILFTMYTLEQQQHTTKQFQEIQKLQSIVKEQRMDNEKHSIVFWGDPEPYLDNVLWIWYEWFLHEPNCEVEWCTPQNIKSTPWDESTWIISSCPSVPRNNNCTYFLLGIPEHFPFKTSKTYFITDSPPTPNACPVGYGSWDNTKQCLHIDTLYQTKPFTHIYISDQDYILQWPKIDTTPLCSIMHINSQSVTQETNIEKVRFLTERASWVPLLNKTPYSLWTIQHKKTLITTHLDIFKQFGEQGLYHPSVEKLHTNMQFISQEQQLIWQKNLQSLYNHFTLKKILQSVQHLSIYKSDAKKVFILSDDPKDEPLMVHIIHDLQMEKVSDISLCDVIWYSVKDGTKQIKINKPVYAWFIPEDDLDWNLFPTSWTFVMGHDTVRTAWINNGAKASSYPWTIRPTYNFLSNNSYQKTKATWKTKDIPKAKHIICKNYPLLPFCSKVWKRIHHQSTFWIPDDLTPKANEWFDPLYNPWVKTYHKPWKLSDSLSPIWATSDLYHQAVLQWGYLFRGKTTNYPNQTM